MNKENLGRLERVNLRNIWNNESADFTPWLAKEENLELLGDTLGIELQLEAQEKDVGPFRADIVCKDTSDDSWVLIENQLEVTDHSHLGQILTYAAGLGAVTVVWIAERFTDEHRATLDWLNEISGENVQFFGLEIEVWQIGPSEKAPKFNMVVKPNDWTKGGAGTTRIRESDLTEAKKHQLEFWRGFKDYIIEHSKLVKPTKPLPQHWMNIALGRSGFKLTAIASRSDSQTGSYGSHEIRVELEVFDREDTKEYYGLLEQAKMEIEAEVGEPLIWYNPEKARVCRIYLRRPTNLLDDTARQEQYGWLLSKLELFHKVFAQRVRDLELPQTE
jgi:hypothetical protein